MKHIVQFSGGAASSYVAWLAAEEFGREHTTLLFNDTRAEHEDAYRFRAEVAAYIGLPITEASSGEDLWQCIVRNNALPSAFIPFCTGDLKLAPTEKYLATVEGPYTLYNGLGPEEWRRVQRSITRAASKGRTLRCLLYERSISNVETKRIIRDEWGIRLPSVYEHLEHNNCVPCFKGGEWHWYQVSRHYPEEFARAVEMERVVGWTVFPAGNLEEMAAAWAIKPPKQPKGKAQLSLPCMCAV